MSDDDDMRATPAPPDGRFNGRWLRKLPTRREVKLARERGLLGDDSEVLSGVLLEKYPPWILLALALLGGIPALPFLLLIHRSCFVIVTPSDVIVTRFYAFGRARKAMDRALRLKRPVRFSLKDPPALERQMSGHKVRFPPEVADHVGAKSTYVVLGEVADYTFRIAGTPQGRAEDAHVQ